MPRPRSLTLPGIAAAALGVIDRDGLAALTMRAVAGALGTGTMSLYRYVDDREQLERLVVDLVLLGVDLELPPGDPWDKGVVVLAERVRAAIGAHASVVPLLLAHRHAAEGSLRFGEAMLGLLSDGGFTGENRVIAFRTLLSYVLGVLQYQYLALPGAGTTVLAQLPQAEYQLLAETARDAQRIAPDEEFRRGLEVVLRGLRAGGSHC
ncbi:transcriptional regulator, TetR family [Singulisphaera sp. GP187]|uniref:TetR/AcrR family transcriptional regulator n=1 Tax=Singulisphaera sp. GP187 TaxID=1882752 RepID=UPI0009282BA8|nr:TetR/AcrR family transcriptional regulator C-terminal domain-containing protein [Singulisphaera sp. GP187]SIN85889.1 transcriptional regulator, TetR family [Singulisphaera sp. GP187]